MNRYIISILILSIFFSGCIDNGSVNKRALTEDEKIIGTWKIDTNIMKGSFTFNSDKTGTFSSQLYGNVYFNWQIQNGKIYSNELKMLDPMGTGIDYKIVNNDRSLVIGTLSFDKS
jgi:hypothetical protein